MPPILRTCCICFERSLRSNAALLGLADEAFGLVSLDGLLRPLDQGDHVAHAEDARRDPVRVEGLDGVELLADADQLDRAAGDRAHAERRAAPPVAIDPGQRDPGEADPLVEGAGDIDRVLAGQRIGDQQGLRRHGHVAHRRALGHQLLVHVEPAGGVQQDDVVALLRAGLHGAPGDRDRALAGDDRQHLHLRLHAECGELLHGRWPAGVERGHQHPLLVAHPQEAAELGGGGGLAGALQAHHEDRSGWGGGGDADLGGLAAQHLDHAVVDDLYDLLAGRDRAQHVVPDGLFLDRVEQRAHRRQRRIGFQQGHAHFPAAPPRHRPRRASRAG